MAILAKVLLVLTTIVCLLSMGGAMLFAAPVLVPLHVLAARRTHSPYSAGGWVFLAAASLFEWSWMALDVVTDSEVLAVAIGGTVAVATIVVLLVDTARRTVPAA